MEQDEEGGQPATVELLPAAEVPQRPAAAWLRAAPAPHPPSPPPPHAPAAPAPAAALHSGASDSTAPEVPAEVGGRSSRRGCQKCAAGAPRLQEPHGSLPPCLQALAGPSPAAALATAQWLAGMFAEAMATESSDPDAASSGEWCTDSEDGASDSAVGDGDGDNMSGAAGGGSYADLPHLLSASGGGDSDSMSSAGDDDGSEAELPGWCESESEGGDSGLWVTDSQDGDSDSVSGAGEGPEARLRDWSPAVVGAQGGGGAPDAPGVVTGAPQGRVSSGSDADPHAARRDGWPGLEDDVPASAAAGRSSAPEPAPLPAAAAPGEWSAMQRVSSVIVATTPTSRSGAAAQPGAGAASSAPQFAWQGPATQLPDGRHFRSFTWRGQAYSLGECPPPGSCLLSPPAGRTTPGLRLAQLWGVVHACGRGQWR